MNTEITHQPITSYPITDSHPMEGMDLLSAIGNTPLLPLRRVSAGISPKVKLPGHRPGLLKQPQLLWCLLFLPMILYITPNYFCCHLVS